MNEPIDLEKLAADAAKTAYDPRAQRCWPWSHQWTMWADRRVPGYTSIWEEQRRCVRCGKSQNKII